MPVNIGRRELIAALGSAATWPLTARSQQPIADAILGALLALAAPQQTQAQTVPRVGWMFPGSSAGNPTELAGFKEGLRELGYVEGRNVVVEYRFGEHSVERLLEFATELARLNASVIVAIGDLAVRAARRAAPGHAHRVPHSRPDRRRAGDQPEPAGRQYHRRCADAPRRQVAGAGQGGTARARPRRLPHQSDEPCERHHLERRATLDRRAGYRTSGHTQSNARRSWKAPLRR